MCVSMAVTCVRMAVHVFEAGTFAEKTLFRCYFGPVRRRAMVVSMPHLPRKTCPSSTTHKAVSSEV